jgi:hypothetical protein
MICHRFMERSTIRIYIRMLYTIIISTQIGIILVQKTLYVKLLFVEYDRGYAIIEFIGEWNDAISNDVMYLKRNVADHLRMNGINKYILIGENVFNFHGSDDCYYEEWFDDLEEGWIAAINFREFIFEEWKKYDIDKYINFGGSLSIANWRTMPPDAFCQRVTSIVCRRIELI